LNSSGREARLVFYQIDTSDRQSSRQFMPFSFTAEQRQTILWVVVGLLLAALLVLLGPILSPFIAAAILAYALNPAVDWLAARRIGRFKAPRVLAVIAVLLLLLVAILLLILIVAPMLNKQLPLLQERLPNFLIRVNDWLTPWLEQLGVQVRLDSAGIKEMVTEHLAASKEQVWSTVLTSAKVGGTAVLGWMATLFLVPIVLFYLMVDWNLLLQRCENAIPRRWVDKSLSMAREVDGLLAQYLRGQLLVMLVLATFYSIALAIAGFDVALPVGIITGLLGFIPYIGFGLGLILALIAALLQFDGLQGLISVAVIYGAGQVLESFVLTPYLVGERIGLHPVAVIFALLAFGQLFGFVGVLLALPASAALSVALMHMRSHYIHSSFYNQR
jgi:predicted PurR-regulated permease PerM